MTKRTEWKEGFLRACSQKSFFLSLIKQSEKEILEILLKRVGRRKAGTDPWRVEYLYVKEGQIAYFQAICPLLS